jgi:hypothetical protein
MKRDMEAQLRTVAERRIRGAVSRLRKTISAQRNLDARSSRF